MSKAFVFLNCDMGSEESIVVQMKKIFGVSQASGVSGIYDIVAEVDSDSEKGIAGIVGKLRSIDSIRSCLTMIVAESRIDNASRMITR
ncbi:MAG TPA: Lrp/AsnC family transcriptional regulator [Nitrososphaera sp.]|nr:Lrp/AsnC family transcriptional regulator [Nitrososphaera sp.]